MHRLLILSRHASVFRDLILLAGALDLEIITATDPDQIPAGGLDCSIILGEPSLICRVLPVLSSLKWVQSTWAGVEPLVVPGLRRDYVLTNARGVFGSLMSEFVFGYMLARERRILERHFSQQEMRWDTSLPGRLSGKTIGLMGVGSIGSALAKTGKHFGMIVKGYSRSSSSCPEVNAWFHGPDLPRFAENLDYLVCTLPNTTQTRRLVNAAFLQALPKRAVLFNVGRGNALDETDLVAALKSGTIAGAVLDVFEEEPLPPDHALWHTPNVIITSHTAAPSFPQDIAPLFLENYHRMIQGLPLFYRVDFEKGY